MYMPLRAGRESNSFIRAVPNENIFKVGLSNPQPKDMFVRNEPNHHKIINRLEKAKHLSTKGRVA